MVEHVTITDPNIHEPKGVSTAPANRVYRANGAGSGVWSILGSNSLNMSEIEGVLTADAVAGTFDLPYPFYLTGVIADVSAPSSILFSIPHDVTIVGARYTLGGAITLANSTVSVTNAAAASLGTGTTIAFSGSGEGVGFSFTATANNVLTGPTWIKVATDGASTTTAPLYVTIYGIR